MLQSAKNGFVVKCITDPVGSNLFKVSGGGVGPEIRQQNAKLAVGGYVRAFDLDAWGIKMVGKGHGS
jgi:hypothetical protein